ncbi:MAG: aldehyde dehydrogenase family protein [Salibacteraceae bacterium]|nr:aldehyde dehydrogenase family protein [Salibacteraceae bacterium]|tara:strand:- start:5267 stop:6139 length:873 start_codon:yes stop_codon:yes gene_type:complete
MARLEIKKTYKIYIGGKFPRTESGRFYNPKGIDVNVCKSSRKDFRNAVVVARAAQPAWAGRSAYNRAQILYRIAEIMEGRRAQFISELELQGSSKKQADEEVNATIDRWVYYAGWCDKYQQIFSSVNPVASNHFNFSVLEPMGVVAATAPEESSLLGISTIIATAIAGGNSLIAIASESKPLCSVTLAEVLNDSDVPGGVVNILTGNKDELLPHIVQHMDVNALVYCGSDKKVIIDLKEKSADNLKRIAHYSTDAILSDSGESPYFIKTLNEVKTTWHPIEKVGAVGSSY